MTDTDTLKLALTRAYEAAVINEARGRGWPCNDFGEAIDVLPREVFQTLREAFMVQIAALEE